MRTLMHVVGCLLTYILLLISGYKFGTAMQHVWEEPTEYLYFGISTIIFYLLMVKYGGKRLCFAQTFTHELIHALFVTLSLGTVHEFHVNQETGHVISDKDNLTVKLSPYFFPIYTLLLMAIRPGIREVYFPIFDIVSGCSFAFYLHMIKNERGLWQSDIQSVSWYISYPYMICMELLFCYLITESLHTNMWQAILQMVQYIGHLLIGFF